MSARAAAGLIASALVSACAAAAPPAGEAADAPPIATAAFSAARPGESPLHAYYRVIEEHYAARGLMRTERAPADAPFFDDDLIRDFERIAFFTEFDLSEGLAEKRTPARLTKWTGPIAYAVAGDGATEADRRVFRDFAARLARVTGLDFAQVDAATGEPDITVLIASPGQRAAFLEMARQRGSEPLEVFEAWAEGFRYPCLARIKVEGPPRKRRRTGLIAILAETEGVQRRACIEEEMAQILGLPNDDPRARPSIFNDDQEFALLTTHDEYLLRILYDPRLKAGMTRAEGMPVVREIVAEIGPGRRG